MRFLSSDIRYVRELEDVNEVKTQLCILFFLMLNIFRGGYRYFLVSYTAPVP